MCYYVLTFDRSLTFTQFPAGLKRPVIKIVMSFNDRFRQINPQGPAQPRSHWQYNFAYSISVKISDMF